MIHLTVSELVLLAQRATGDAVQVRDFGLLASAAGRPQATAFDAEAYPTLEHKAAALLHALARNHALVDGNKRLALGGLIAFLGINGRRLTLSDDEAYGLIMAVASNELDDVGAIAEHLLRGLQARAEP